MIGSSWRNSNAAYKPAMFWPVANHLRATTVAHLKCIGTLWIPDRPNHPRITLSNVPLAPFIQDSCFSMGHQSLLQPSPRLLRPWIVETLLTRRTVEEVLPESHAAS